MRAWPVQTCSTSYRLRSASITTPFFPENLMVLRARQRGEAEKLYDVERQLLLNDRDVASNSLCGVRGETQDVARERDYALRLPGQQHPSIFGDLVLPFLGPREVVGIDILKTDEHARDTCAFRFLDEIRDLVAQCVDLDHEAERDCVSLAQQDEAVEDRLPFSVPREVVIGDEEFMDALRPIEPYEMLDVIGRAEARLAALHVDDGAERALIGTAAARIEARA